MNQPLPSGAILAGGASRRMGGGQELSGETKALAQLAGRPMIEHVIDRLRPQVGRLYLSVDARQPELELWPYRQVEDPRPGRHGPLGGLLAVLEAMPEAATEDTGWLLLAPCDAPFLPPDLGSRLMNEARNACSPGAVAAYRGELQPTFSLWHCTLLPALRHAVLEQRLGGFKAFLDRHSLPMVEWPAAAIDPFFNVNTPADFTRAESLVDPPRAGV